MANGPDDSVDEAIDSNVETGEVSEDTTLSASQKQARKSRSTKTLNRVMIFEKEN